MMIRNCFLCGSEVENIYTSNWSLPGLAPTEIGFSICPDCGSVCQSPTVRFEEMMTFYNSIAVYTNPGRKELPTPSKTRDVDEQIQFITRGIGKLPTSALQIGSSDGYTLSRFEAAGVEQVLGIEPGKASVEIAKRLYDINSINTSAEDFETTDSYELILMTHVLEHLYTPQAVLKKCYEIQQDLPQGFIYVEVPYMANVSSLCPGFFAFEHINHYTRENLIKSLTDIGYWPVSAVEHFNSNLAPVIGVLASTKPQQHYPEFQNQYRTNKQLVQEYRQKEVAYWQQCVDNISAKISGNVYLWGAGIHTCQLVANTNLLDTCSITGLTDTSPLKWGVIQGDWTCRAPKDIDWQAGDTVIISSYASQREIYNALSWLRDIGVQTLRLHNQTN
ncbi:bifunctional 2-polyprenyl-6-hydroxyphenol methylase/3-demethylubiquinol 3-O-methyltransferase UbiG [Shewanella sp. Scap07]|uniref:class I SAM-dependent methyltransferase n=1 Tax=Shewanella sp. Scap07 TaxID=2589987 RepID=UPI0021184C60|nr:methyltransferase domain-containing protein [Shewanella sp. Scap07]